MNIKEILYPVMGLLPVSFSFQGCNQPATLQQKSSAPNVVIIFLDDAGWADFEPFGQNKYSTPNLNKLAGEGRQFHNFYVPQAVCSASRSALLTGCYPERTGMHGAHGPNARGVDPSFATIAEVLQKNNYYTGMFGKWHIGDQDDTRPHNRGFDESAGIMYSNDMWADHPVNPDYWGEFPLRYWQNGQVKIDSVTHEHQEMFTTWITEDAVDFINRNHENPFFLYVAHPQPHVPLFVSDKHRGVSSQGLYGDVIMEIDWSVGEIMGALKEHNVEENTMVIFTSDNGPWITYGDHAGKTPFRAGKTTSFDGGIRSPLVIKYPDQIKKGTISDDCFFSIDFLPSIAHITGAQLPENKIDGKNVWNIIKGEENAKNPHDYYAVSLNNRLEAILSPDGRWKLHLPHNYFSVLKSGGSGSPGNTISLKTDTTLFDLQHDPYEKKGNVMHLHPDVLSELLNYAEMHREKFYSKN
ncbi:MAG: sulfatase [Bacteroidota bacterium]